MTRRPKFQQIVIAGFRLQTQLMKQQREPRTPFWLVIAACLPGSVGNGSKTNYQPAVQPDVGLLAGSWFGWIEI